MKNINNKKIFVCATEQSGDNIGEKIISGLKREFPKLLVEGVGGSKMKPLMKKQFYSLKEFKSIGIIEIIFSINKFIKIINHLSSMVLKNNYSLIITIDSPDFNYPLAKKIKNNKFNGKIIQVVAPTVWAWRQSRAKKFSKVFDKIFTLFKFENIFFEKHNLKGICIGHPIYYIKNKSNLIKNKNLIAFLPGSRQGEVKSLFRYFELAYMQILKSNQNFYIFIPTLPHLKKDIIKRTKLWKIKTIITTNNKEIDKHFLKVKVALVCSGTASLEIAKRGIPQLVIYKLNYFTELILNFFVKVKFANILNIIEKKMIIPELINSKLQKKIFIKMFDKLLLDFKFQNSQIKSVYKLIKKIEQREPPHIKAVNQIKKIL